MTITHTAVMVRLDEDLSSPSFLSRMRLATLYDTFPRIMTSSKNKTNNNRWYWLGQIECLLYKRKC
ncbi:MAG TPA: hypothetical protein VI278_16670 [Nitrososphaeraceae archaeon]